MDISMWKNMSFPFKHYLFSPYKIPEKRENIRVFRGLVLIIPFFHQEKVPDVSVFDSILAHVYLIH